MDEIRLFRDERAHFWAFLLVISSTIVDVRRIGPLIWPVCAVSCLTQRRWRWQVGAAWPTCWQFLHCSICLFIIRRRRSKRTISCFAFEVTTASTDSTLHIPWVFRSSAIYCAKYVWSRPRIISDVVSSEGSDFTTAQIIQLFFNKSQHRFVSKIKPKKKHKTRTSKDQKSLITWCNPYLRIDWRNWFILFCYRGFPSSWTQIHAFSQN